MKYLLFLLFFISLGAYSQILVDDPTNFNSASQGDLYIDNDNVYYIGLENGALKEIGIITQKGTANGQILAWNDVSGKWELNRVSSTIILNRQGGNNILPTATNTYFDFPINSNHIQVNQGSTYSVTGNGEIQINEDGLYQLSASLSTNNLPAGGTKFILGVFLNGTLIGYLSRGFVTLPSQDFWGTSGTLSYVLSAQDRVRFRYVLNAGGATLNAVFINASISKL